MLPKNNIDAFLVDLAESIELPPIPLKKIVI